MVESVTSNSEAGNASSNFVQGIDLMSEAAAVDLCKDAFTAYSDANFK